MRSTTAAPICWGGGVSRWICRRRVRRNRPEKALFDFDEPDLIHQAVGGHHVAVWCDIHVADDVAAARNGPGLEFFGLRIETDDGVRLGERLVVPKRALGEDDAVGLRLRTTGRGPLADLAVRRIEPAVFGGDTGLGIELADQAGAIAGEPDVAVAIFGQSVRAGVGRLERVLADRPGLRIDPAELVRQLPAPPDRAVSGGQRIVRA